MTFYRYSVLVLILFLAACSGASGSPTATLVPTLEPPLPVEPVEPPPPVEPTAEPLEEPSPEATLDGPPITPTMPAPADELAAASSDAIFIAQPGALSEIVSPVVVAGVADPAFEQNLVIQVTDENGGMLSFQPVSIQAEIGQRGPFEAQVEFSVTNDQPGRISVFSVDARDGSLVHLSSVEVTLLAAGEAVIQLPTIETEVIEIISPEFQADVTGGVLVIEGFSEYFFEANLSVVLCADGSDSDVPHPVCGTANNVFLETFATIDSPDIGQPGPFRAEIEYSVEGPKTARVVVYATSPRDGGLLHVSSTLVTLLP